MNTCPLCGKTHENSKSAKAAHEDGVCAGSAAFQDAATRGGRLYKRYKAEEFNAQLKLHNEFLKYVFILDKEGAEPPVNGEDTIDYKFVVDWRGPGWYSPHCRITPYSMQQYLEYTFVSATGPNPTRDEYDNISHMAPYGTPEYIDENWFES